MKVSLNWLKKYVSFKDSHQQLANRLTMIGLEVEEIHDSGTDFSGVLVGKVLTVDKHPSADKLSICSVDTGDQKLHIVCGASNVAEGQIVPVAPEGAVLGGNFTIERRTIRGEVSEGMICSEKELGIGENHDGIMVLDQNQFSVGEIFKAQAQDPDVVFEVNITPNRPDCLSHLGIAREVAAIYRNKINFPEDHVDESDSIADKLIDIDIMDIKACPRYSARVVRNVKIGPSPEWLRELIESIGLRSINNVVDVTNYVLYETGQPLHAFDYKLISDRKIVVRKAKEKELFTTLDSIERKLNSNDLLICDGQKAVALAGVMGGENSEVSEDTTDILLESAYFDPMTIRKTSKRLGLSTDASQRFERGIDPNGTIYAVNRAAKLIAECAGGNVAKGIVDVYPEPVKAWQIQLRPSRVSHVLGIDIKEKEISDLLSRLDLIVEKGDPMGVTVPTFRPDLRKEIDLIEEVVRHYGYEKIEPNTSSTLTLSQISEKNDSFIELVRDIFVGMGFIEVLNNSLVSDRHVHCFSKTSKAMVLQNPLSPDNMYLRNSLLPELLDSVQYNRNRTQSNLRFFEIGRIFIPESKLPAESVMVSGIVTGFLRTESFWGENDQKINYFHVKGFIENLFQRLHVQPVEFVSEKATCFTEETSSSVFSGKTKFGSFGQIQSAILEVWDIEESVFGFEFKLSNLEGTCTDRQKYKAIPRFPSVKRDLALVLDNEIAAGTLQNTILAAGGEYIQKADIFDIYTGKQIPEGKKSVAFSLIFTSDKRTLTEVDIEPAVEKIIKKVKSDHGAVLRS